MLRASPPHAFLGKDVQERRCISNSLTKRNISVLTEGCAASIIDQKTNQLRISGSRVLGRLKKSCKCCGNPDIYAIHLLPTAYPSKKLANLREKTSNQFEKKSFSPSLCFLLLIFSYSIFSLSSNLHIKLEKKRNIIKEKKNQLQIKKMAH